jgi:DNA-binding response OmpR family regulator
MTIRPECESLCVLLVDDNPQTLDDTATYLSTQGTKVVALNSPFGVTNAVRRERPDVIVLDVMRPGLSGGGLGAIIRRESEAPIIYFSAISEEDLRDLTLVTQNTSYVLKSEGVAFLASEVKRLSQRRRPSSRTPKPTA